MIEHKIHKRLKDKLLLLLILTPFMIKLCIHSHTFPIMLSAYLVVPPYDHTA